MQRPSHAGSRESGSFEELEGSHNVVWRALCLGFEVGVI